MLTLKNLKSPKGSHKNIKRIGRGEGSGWGQQAGKGHKGQKARSGGKVAIGFEGGSMPLYMRLPKRGQQGGHFRTQVAEVNLSRLENFSSPVVNRQTLIEEGLLKGQDKHRPVKILANGEFSKKLDFSDSFKFSKKAKELIEKNGGSFISEPKSKSQKEEA